MPRRLPFLLPLLLSTPLLAQGWSGTLQDGRRVEIDPASNRAIEQSARGGQPLWDGVHRTETGEVVIVRDGVAISHPPQSQTPLEQEPDSGRDRPLSACVELAVKSCGFHGACAGREPCQTARQLVRLEHEESWRNKGNRPEQSDLQCRDGLLEETRFPACDAASQLPRPTPCDQLVTHVCGIRQGCSQSSACSAARQLLEMELGERRANRDPQRPVEATTQCLEAVRDGGFFAQCRHY
ncbi:MAG: hypothetical protein B0D96_05940 [Candidatus Sedimenticola endophacoides]|uniref:Uncharacterized protein n=1 Tax=Candidatus Sedimenticola endophacoides TaxID=2548426 RepID=A0A6N4E265_9GAMM|nr:MAG: hypothetical protein B0D94_07125 [Candidatus Sedimenticola endophacoides]OQX35787.1 MAG: hypothetical protein B0D96_05940 [Candidatus Sedimenticola endophacoides]OQX42292.1 MAG: hypothetical protein B0D89_01565 [Candidatus Sedimenticola endophacoides]PUE00819.1 MAG: hypothetical protein C3L26_04775 [Candidatus Sedimenticola endophacoides]PUE04258.1 MAG: hypothetical protein C3L25_04765 [Candidatus Sedimenticola endophacoides]